ncbi:hypothetical protein [Actinophytocola gossypii]|uniref:DUF3558 domain-containing protein n=1 Tax=Actinophytocola gossypii TaxID=2812003 RepID=A0ABT2J5T2_9PSEU|nr:hypothetical protein [Actinophytocola gossypii]MCT2582850.1 hypothetical protein [Actinophytocola gossypii]
MRRTALGVVAVALLMAGCGSEGGTNDDPGGDQATSEQAGGATGSISDLADDLCSFIDTATIEEQYGESVEDAQGGLEQEERESVSCTYVTESVMASDVENIDKALDVSTTVRTASSGSTDPKDALDKYFVDADAKTVAYTPIEGLGDAAGYADTSLEVRMITENHLVAILELDDGQLVEVITTSSPQGTQEQLRALADELVPAVESRLR